MHQLDVMLSLLGNLKAKGEGNLLIVSTFHACIYTTF